ncbi:MAG: RluA family pseudouridine synthase [Oligosphaeraceae bacterium]
MILPFPPMERTVQVVTPPDAAGASLLEFLTLRYNYLDREQWLQEIRRGNLFLDGATAREDTLLRGGENLFFQAGDLKEQEVSFQIQVLEETEEYLILHKPGNLPCHPAGRFFNHTLWAWLRQARHLSSIHFVNRLDRETSGIVLVGKTPRFAATAAKLFHSLCGETQKKYLVLVHGRVPWKQFFANGWLMKDPRSPVGKKRRFQPILNQGDSDVVELPEDDEAVTAQTDFQLLDYRRPPRDDEPPGRFPQDEQGEFSLLEATLHTGRTHQIRATLCSLGFPVVGDKLYGVDDTIFLRFATSTLSPRDWQRLILPTQALHAWKLRIPRLHIQATAPPPWLP